MQVECEWQSYFLFSPHQPTKTHFGFPQKSMLLKPPLLPTAASLPTDHRCIFTTCMFFVGLRPFWDANTASIAPDEFVGLTTDQVSLLLQVTQFEFAVIPSSMSLLLRGLLVFSRGRLFRRPRSRVADPRPRSPQPPKGYNTSNT